jgi:hypothetical protein
MGRAHVRARGSFPPERFVAALTDFGADRSEIEGNSSPAHLAVHDLGPTWAEVTEGSDAGGEVGQRLRYGWAAPDVVPLTVFDSNAFGLGGRFYFGRDLRRSVRRIEARLGSPS